MSQSGDDSIFFVDIGSERSDWLLMQAEKRDNVVALYYIECCLLQYCNNIIIIIILVRCVTFKIVYSKMFCSYSTGWRNSNSHCFTYEWASNEVKILGHKRKVHLLPIIIRTIRCWLIIASGWRLNNPKILTEWVTTL